MALTISRRKGETIVIELFNGEAEVRVVRLGRGRVRLAVTAPRTTKVLRGELRERADGEQTADRTG